MHSVQRLAWHVTMLCSIRVMYIAAESPLSPCAEDSAISHRNMSLMSLPEDLNNVTAFLIVITQPS